MNTRRARLLALLVSVAVLAGTLVPAALAYIAVQSNLMVNTFDVPELADDAAFADVRVHKTVNCVGAQNVGPEGFTFVLTDAQTGQTFTMTTDASGYASVKLPLADHQIGRAYTYRLAERNDGRANITYSDKVYTIAVTLSVRENRIVADLTLDGAPVSAILAEFENTYNAGVVLPDTGDDTCVLLYAVMLLVSGACVIFLMTKRGRVW